VAELALPAAKLQRWRDRTIDITSSTDDVRAHEHHRKTAELTTMKWIFSWFGCKILTLAFLSGDLRS
jgi:hypothetical protein